MSSTQSKEKQESQDIAQTPMRPSIELGKFQDDPQQKEVFGDTEDGVKFKTVHWTHAAMIFLKNQFATGVLALPASLLTLGAAPGAVCIVLWGIINTWGAIILGDFRKVYPACHSIADMAQIIGGPILCEICGILFLFAYVICAASGIVGTSVGLNALSDHAVCTNWFSFVAMIAVGIIAGIRKFEKLAWVTWAGFFSIFIAIFIVVVAVTTLDRPAAAPQTGDFELGFYVVAYPTFTAAVVAITNVFTASSAASAFVSVIAEMKNPEHYNKAVYVSMGFVEVCYLCFSLVIYRYCGQWISTPSLGSGGPLIKKIAYGVGLLGLLVSAGLWSHIAAKYLFVRILRNSNHLQKNSVIHWGTWLGCVSAVVIASFLLASGVPIFQYIIALAGSVSFGPLALIIPGFLWIHIHKDYWRGGVMKASAYGFHVFLIILGTFITVGGTYGVIASIVEAYANGSIGSAFSCADNSNSV